MQIDEDVAALIKLSLRNRGYIDLPANGTSMFPYIRSGKICRFLPCEVAMLKKGRILLYVSISGQLVAHRLYRTLREGDEAQFLCKGDTNIDCDPVIGEDQIIGVLASMRDNKGDKVRHAGDFTSNLWSYLVRNVPYVSYFLNRYVNKVISRRMNRISP